MGKDNAVLTKISRRKSLHQSLCRPCRASEWNKLTTHQVRYSVCNCNCLVQ